MSVTHPPSNAHVLQKGELTNFCPPHDWMRTILQDCSLELSGNILKLRTYKCFKRQEPPEQLMQPAGLPGIKGVRLQDC